MGEEERERERERERKKKFVAITQKCSAMQPSCLVKYSQGEQKLRAAAADDDDNDDDADS